MSTSAFHRRLTEFGPAEAARITGVSTVNQRAWRHRGLLSTGRGWTKFFSSDLATLMLRRTLGSLGIPHLKTDDRFWPVIFEIEGWIDMSPDALAFAPGADPNQFRREMPQTTGFLGAHFAIARPTWKPGEEILTLCSDIDDVRLRLREGPDAGVALIDLVHIAKTISERAGRPLATILPGPDPDDLETGNG